MMMLTLGIGVLLLANIAASTRTHKVGDMILTDDQYNQLPESQKVGGVETNDNGEEGREEEKRNAIKDESYRWPGGVIPYVFDGSFSRKEKRIVREAMDIWSKYTCVSFRPARQGKDKNRIRIKNGDGCSSMVGMVDGTQEVNLQKHGCRDVATALHELGHSIGLYHTQSRPDRDQHLIIDLSGVGKENHYNFEKKTWEHVHHYGVNYDYHSIMHYGSKDFGDDSGKVIRTKNPKFQKIIGEAKTLSFGDIEMVYKMYKCTPRSCNLKDSDCPGISFVDASCKCLCPGPSQTELVQLCEGAPTGETGDNTGGETGGNTGGETGGNTGGTNNEETTTPLSSTEETVTVGSGSSDEEWSSGETETTTEYSTGGY